MGELEPDPPTSRHIRPELLLGFGMVFPERSQVLRAYYQDIDDRRRRRAGEFEDELRNATAGQCSVEELIERILADERVGELFERAVQEALLTADDHKRYLLAQVAAAALRGTTTPRQVEALNYLLRTVIALDSPDIAMLVIIGTTADREPRATQDSAQRKEIDARWSSPHDLVDPALAAIQQQGLLEGVTDYDGGIQCRLSSYGRRFLDYLLTDLGGWPPRRQLEGG